MYVLRTLEPYLQTTGEHFPVILVMGARQVGKTTLLRHSSQTARNYVTLDDPLALELARRDPALFLQRYTPPLLIDEIQYAPELLPYIKMDVDEQRLAGQYWLTGSQQFHLMQGVSESLAGRVGIFQLLGLSYKEIIGYNQEAAPFLPSSVSMNSVIPANRTLTLPLVYQYIWRGAFPAIALDKQMNRDLFYSSYVQTYLQRDVHDLARVGDNRSFMRFLRAAAARTGQLLNLSELARDADIAVNTAKSWLSILETSGIIYLLEPWHNNVTKRLIKTPKLYFLDTGLCAYLTEWSSAETLEAGAAAGAFLETWMLVELLKSYWHNGQRAPFYYYRDKDQKEIDLLIIKDGVLYPIEFKKTASPRLDDIRHFSVLEKFKMPIGMGAVICLVKEVMPLTATVMAIPVSFL